MQKRLVDKILKTVADRRMWVYLNEKGFIRLQALLGRFSLGSLLTTIENLNKIYQNLAQR